MRVAKQAAVVVAQSGLALLELLLAMGLSSIMVLVLYSAHRQSQQGIVYSQQITHATRLLYQVATQVVGYPQHYINSVPMVVDSSLADLGVGATHRCFNGVYCEVAAMTAAWSAKWQETIGRQLPEGALLITCANPCSVGGDLVVQLQWRHQQPFKTHTCPSGRACLSLKIRL